LTRHTRRPGLKEIDLSHVNSSIRTFALTFAVNFRADRRETVKSVLFDMHRRSSLGWDAVYLGGIDFLRELCQEITPEELGSRMRTIGSRPYALQPVLLTHSYLAGRQQHMLDLGLSGPDGFDEDTPQDVAFLMDFTERLLRSYRNDGVLFPSEASNNLCILSDQLILEVVSYLRPRTEEESSAIRRAAATLGSYCLLLHGEQRDGIFGHGPYHLADGTVLFFKEFNDLRNDYLPWAQTSVSNLLDNVVFAYAAKDVTVSCDLWGTSYIEPRELGDRLQSVAVLTNERGTIRELSDEEIKEVQQRAISAQEELYLRAIEWDDRYKIAYAGPLFANHIKPFFDIAGIKGDASDRLLETFMTISNQRLDHYIDAEIPEAWGHITSAPAAEIYWPLSTRR